MRAVRLPVRDSITRDGETVVMAGSKVMLLSPLASAALRLLQKPLTVTDLSAALVEEFGAPPDIEPEEVIRALLEDLAEASLVRLEP